MTKIKKKENSLPTQLSKNGWGVSLTGKTNPMISFGCGAIKVSEPVLNEAIMYLEARDGIKRKISRVNTEINRRERQITELQNQIATIKKEVEPFYTKRNQISNSVKMSRLVKGLNTRVINQIGRDLDTALDRVGAKTRHVKVLKRFFNNKNK